jgi:hypothetical protein
MAKKTRGEQRVAAVTYSQIAEWTGLQLSTVQSYGAKGRIPKHDLEAVLSWVNARRARRGLQPIGCPEQLNKTP